MNAQTAAYQSLHVVNSASTYWFVTLSETNKNIIRSFFVNVEGTAHLCEKKFMSEITRPSVKLAFENAYAQYEQVSKADSKLGMNWIEN